MNLENNSLKTVDGNSFVLAPPPRLHRHAKAPPPQPADDARRELLAQHPVAQAVADAEADADAADAAVAGGSGGAAIPRRRHGGGYG